MSPKLPVVTGKEVARAAERLGFEFRRQTGSHAIYVRSADRARGVIPMHSGVAIKRRTLRRIIEELASKRDSSSTDVPFHAYEATCSVNILHPLS